MTNANDPINPIPDLNNHPSSWYGLTKREYFAAMALQGICGNQEFLKNLNAEPEKVSVACVEISDALINALNETK